MKPTINVLQWWLQIDKPRAIRFLMYSVYTWFISNSCKVMYQLQRRGRCSGCTFTIFRGLDLCSAKQLSTKTACNISSDRLTMSAHSLSELEGLCWNPIRFIKRRIWWMGLSITFNRQKKNQESVKCKRENKTLPLKDAKKNYFKH
jgi:hypothetical protein